MIICGCALEAQYIRRQKETEKPKLRDSWAKFIEKQEEKKKEVQK